MKLFEGKTKSERNKTIAAIVLGGACLIVLFFAFGRGMFGGGKSTATAKPSPTPKKTSASSSQTAPGKVEMPSPKEQELGMMVPINYQPGAFTSAPPGRNIFAFYEPPEPCKVNCPTPVPPPSPTPPPPSPVPTPPITIAAINPQSIYAGSEGFRMEINGDKFTPDTKIYFEQQEIPAAFVSETKMTADILYPLIRNEGRKTIMAQSTDGTKISNPIQFDVQPAPKPSFQYVGMIARRRGNNDTAYFQEQGKPLPTGARLNDVVGGRFRVISISEAEAVLEDVSLGFKHKLPLYSPPPGTVGPGGSPPPKTFPGAGGREVYTPGNPMPQPGSGVPGRGTPAGIPENIPRYVPPSNRAPSPTKQQQNSDDDDDGID